jgi:hypothetical protein
VSRVNYSRMLSVFLVLFVFIVWICSLYRILNVHPLCPMHLSEYSLNFNWYTPLWLYISIVPSLGFRLFGIVLVALYAIFMLVFLNNFVIFLVSGP